MSCLPTPTVAVIIGEGGSGGALALGVADRVLMLEHAIYSVISPEGAAAILCGQAIIAVGNLALVPLYLERWAPTVYGEWVALTALSGYLATLDFGINMAVTNRLTQAYARRDLEDYASCQHSALAYYLALASGGSFVLGLALWTLPFPAWVGLAETSATEAKWVIWLTGTYSLVAMPAGLISSFYRTTGDLPA